MRLQPLRMEHLSSGRVENWEKWINEHRLGTVDALAGIGQPKRFFTMLRDSGIQLGQTVSLPDHATFQASSFGSFGSRPILITAKDAVKCTELDRKSTRLNSSH